MTLILKKADPNIFDFVYSDMKKQFPVSELKDYDAFVNLLEKTNYELLLAKMDNITIGYVIVAKDNINKVIWLDYIAILEDFHGKGYGSLIMLNLKKYYSDYNGCYLEVEKPDLTCNNTLRRIKFYKNLGAVKLDIDYYYPNKDGMLPMDLYFIAYNNFSPGKLFTQSVINNIFMLLHKNIIHYQEVLSKIK